MPKIDTSKIEGYEAMTPEQKLEALEAFEYDDGASEIATLRTSVQKANGDAAKYKRERDEAKRAGTAAETANQSEIETMRGEIAELKRQARQSDYKARFLALGCSEDVSLSMAESLSAAALSDEGAQTLFSGLKSQLEATAAKALSDAMTGVGKPTGGAAGNPVSADYQKKAKEAKASGDFTAYAYYTRLQTESAAGKT